MLNRFKRTTGLFTVQLLVICFTVFAAAAENIPAGWESYLARPDVLQVPAKAQDMGQAWVPLKAAHFSFIAELLSLYSSDTDLYFLARDSEHLYDVARLVTAGTPEAKHIHLLNVSRGNMRDPNLKAYLKENGISEESASAGRKVVFVDTGFAGTISRVVGEAFSSEVREKFKTHLIVSETSKHPSSRIFLVHLNPAANEKYPAAMHGSIVTYEHMPRYTDRSTQYVLSEGHYHPISPTVHAMDGEVSKEKSLLFMQDLKAEWQKPETKARYLAERAQFDEIKNVLSNPDQNTKQEVKAELEKLKDTAEGRLFEAQVRDFLEARSNAGIASHVMLEELGLEARFLTDQALKKNDLVKKFPEWAAVLDKPKVEIPKLFQEKNWQMIGNLMDLNVGSEFNYLLIQSLYNEAATGVKKDLQILMIEKADPVTLTQIAMSFDKPYAKDMKDLIKLVMEKGGPRKIFLLASGTFAKPFATDMMDLMKFGIEKGDADALKQFEKYVFTQPHTQEAEYQFLRDALKIADPEQRKSFLASHTVNTNPEPVKPAAAVSSPPKPISSSLQPGDVISINNRLLKVTKKAGEGRRGVVFQVVADNGATYALKTGKNMDAETLASIAIESSKAKQWQSLKIPHSKVLVQEKNFVLKTWIEGMRGDEVVLKYAEGDLSYKAAAEQLLKLVAHVRAQGAYVGDFRPANIIWTGKAWVIIDSGSIQQGMTLEEAQAKWTQADERGPKFERRWKMAIPALNSNKCEHLFSKAG
jgi:hypothetical protein